VALIPLLAPALAVVVSWPGSWPGPRPVAVQGPWAWVTWTSRLGTLAHCKDLGPVPPLVAALTDLTLLARALVLVQGEQVAWTPRTGTWGWMGTCHHPQPLPLPRHPPPHLHPRTRLPRQSRRRGHLVYRPPPAHLQRRRTSCRHPPSPHPRRHPWSPPRSVSCRPPLPRLIQVVVVVVLLLEWVQVAVIGAVTLALMG
jgi:hypothetical protein